MKKIIYLLFIFLFLIGCSKKNESNISTQEILANITQEIVFESAIIEDLTDQSVSERYGISPGDLDNGVVYSSSNEDNSDKIILAKAKEESTIENIERAFSNEIVGITDSWKDNETESKKIEQHILKTKGLYVLFCTAENPKLVEEIFDKSLESK